MMNGARKYAQINTQSGVENASPHRLIQMLIDGGLERLHMAKGFAQQNNVTGRGENISRAISIIGGLQASLNLEQGGELADNLYNLYDYMIRRLFEANRDNDLQGIDEVIGLMKQIKEGWDGIADQAKELTSTP